MLQLKTVYTCDNTLLDNGQEAVQRLRRSQGIPLGRQRQI